MQGQVMTVLGPVSADDLGPTVTHEHLLVDLSCYWQRPEDPDRAALAEAPFEMSMIGIVKRDPFFSLDNNVLDDIALAIEEANEFKNLGGGTIVDVTPPDIGRDPLALQTIARSTGLNIVAGTAHYVHLAHPPGLEDQPTDEIARANDHRAHRRNRRYRHTGWGDRRDRYQPPAPPERREGSPRSRPSSASHRLSHFRPCRPVGAPGT